jgi:hypothetical protein
MGTDALARDLLNVEPRQYLTLSGFPSSGDTSKWHVNKAVAMGPSTGGKTYAIVLQRSDASAEWLAIIIEDNSDGIEFSTFNHFEGEEPSLRGDDPGTSVDPNGISVADVES